jgi:hypothetical protein
MLTSFFSQEPQMNPPLIMIPLKRMPSQPQTRHLSDTVYTDNPITLPVFSADGYILKVFPF